MDRLPAAHACRTLFISDVHLGSPWCQAEPLLELLHAIDPERLILVGDIIDLEHMHRYGSAWVRSHTQVIARIDRMAKRGVEVIYVPGNHDHEMRAMTGLPMARVSVRRRLIHTTAAGQRFLVVHGDEFDRHGDTPSYLHTIGDHAYPWVLRAHHALNRRNKRLGRPEVNYADQLKRRLKAVERHIRGFKNKALNEVQVRGLDGIICGHIHRAEIEQVDGRIYANDGDWVESKTALVEDLSGVLQLIEWHEAPLVRQTLTQPKVLDTAIA